MKRIWTNRIVRKAQDSFKGMTESIADNLAVSMQRATTRSVKKTKDGILAITAGNSENFVRKTINTVPRA